MLKAPSSSLFKDNLGAPGDCRNKQRSHQKPFHKLRDEKNGENLIWKDMTIK